MAGFSSLLEAVLRAVRSERENRTTLETSGLPPNIRWQEIGTIGSGGQAQILKVVDKDATDGTCYALKRLAPRKPKQALHRFKAEIEATKGIEHPNIIRIIDASDNADFPYYVMELVKDAVSLKDCMEKGKNPYQGDALQAVDFFIQLAEAIRACEAAKAKVVHRDLSPGNVIIAPNGSIKVIDFGVCWIEGAAGVTMDDESVGTHNYMAPECESGAEGDITSKTDLYSVGKLLWTAVTGQRAYARERAVFDGKSMKMMLPDKPDTFHLHALFEQTIRNSPTDRFPNAAAAIQEAKRIRYLISNHYPPLELLADGMCPTCGAENLKRIPDPYNQNVYSLSWFECEYCGHRFPCTKDDVARKRLIARKNLS